ncbi:hypothetical protein N7E70_016485 [Aminobacter sp. NyZ550]|uniref:hypothetical protein n=1 Tax=unclassified Aminobacter TaxID=2644704 RepID=UPI0012B15B97|nr:MULTISPECIES: hypothetical protein [unclassified Aminobacter]MRX31975.1 hypothetical protein [Aminobacter sp. MDW-2]QNH32443.1 hypothetical protein H5P29_18030 [Aminobacter sp. MDW-2]WAX93290.1 hypothetical protein N7E70_016485 [Aminobacter sp. NyZ550]
MPTLFNAYAEMFRIATFQVDHATRRTKCCDADRLQLDAPQRRCPHRGAKLGWNA